MLNKGWQLFFSERSRSLRAFRDWRVLSLIRILGSIFAGPGERGGRKRGTQLIGGNLGKPTGATPRPRATKTAKRFQTALGPVCQRDECAWTLFNAPTGITRFKAVSCRVTCFGNTARVSLSTRWALAAEKKGRTSRVRITILSDRREAPVRRCDGEATTGGGIGR